VKQNFALFAITSRIKWRLGEVLAIVWAAVLN